MTANDLEDIAEVLLGFDAWRDNKIKNALSANYTVSAYIDELARQRALDAITEIRAVYADEELTWQEVDKQIRSILGVA